MVFFLPFSCLNHTDGSNAQTALVWLQLPSTRYGTGGNIDQRNGRSLVRPKRAEDRGREAEKDMEIL